MSGWKHYSAEPDPVNVPECWRRHWPYRVRAHVQRAGDEYWWIVSRASEPLREGTETSLKLAMRAAEGAYLELFRFVAREVSPI